LNFRSKCCNHEPIKLTADFSLSRLVEDYLTELFNEKNVSEANREKLWTYYYEKLSGGIDKVFTPAILEDSSELANSLKFSIAEFSAFKETAFRKDLEDLMTKDGKFVPWSEFKKEAMKVSGDYNSRWLETEYHQTVANAQSAAKWKDYQRNKDLYPNLRYCTIGDDRVRPEHQVMDGIVKPLDDPFWNNWMPPNDWGCRCYVEQTDDEPTGTVSGGDQLKIEFENNPGKTGRIFNEEISYRISLTEEEVKQVEENLKKWQEK